MKYGHKVQKKIKIKRKKRKVEKKEKKRETDSKRRDKRRERERKKNLLLCKIYGNQIVGFYQNKRQNRSTHRELYVGTKILEFRQTL